MHLKTCQIDGCILPTVTCKKILSDGQICGQPGHPEIYKSDEYHIVAVVRHAHFLPLSMQDSGRNDFHNNKRMMAPESIKQYTWKIKNNRRFPIEVIENLGWGDL